MVVGVGSRAWALLICLALTWENGAIILHEDATPAEFSPWPSYALFLDVHPNVASRARSFTDVAGYDGGVLGLHLAGGVLGRSPLRVRCQCLRTEATILYSETRDLGSTTASPSASLPAGADMEGSESLGVLTAMAAENAHSGGRSLVLVLDHDKRKSVVDQQWERLRFGQLSGHGEGGFYGLL